MVGVIAIYLAAELSRPRPRWINGRREEEVGVGDESGLHLSGEAARGASSQVHLIAAELMEMDGGALCERVHRDGRP